MTYTNWTYPSFPCPSPMLGDPLFLHFDYMQFAQFTDGLWTCWMRILPALGFLLRVSRMMTGFQISHFPFHLPKVEFA